MEHYIYAWKNIFNYKDRATRMQFNCFILYSVIIYIAYVLFFVIPRFMPSVLIIPLIIFFSLYCFVFLSISYRRFVDATGKTRLWLFILFFILAFVLFRFVFILCFILYLMVIESKNP